eukprot:CAMPEP_0177627412 /NCGR_PEP_ID=MMETSP0419_2-20121207/31191_1 /TAXON_ID=582737 /ORGANISM="Tetraselmis sp., Strain GSL018" /LENGTH=187 /DNA_ID=CAMNT_0019128567 /DNA_START=650 /DNA_END=1210 /DNA_ORIENTATION=-
MSSSGFQADYQTLQKLLGARQVGAASATFSPAPMFPFPIPPAPPHGKTHLRGTSARGSVSEEPRWGSAAASGNPLSTNHGSAFLPERGAVAVAPGAAFLTERESCFPASRGSAGTPAEPAGTLWGTPAELYSSSFLFLEPSAWNLARKRGVGRGLHWHLRVGRAAVGYEGDRSELQLSVAGAATPPP